MRLDVRVDKPVRHDAKIYLNDKPVRACVMADDEQGVIERWDTDESGKVRAFYDTGVPEPHLIREYGVVRIELP